MARLLLLLASALCAASAAKLDNVARQLDSSGSFPSFGGAGLRDYLPPAQCTNEVRTVSAPQRTVVRYATSVVVQYGRDQVRTAVVTQQAQAQLRTEYDVVTVSRPAVTVDRFQEVTRTVTVGGQAVTVFTTLYQTRTNVRTVTDRRVATVTDARVETNVVTRVVPTTSYRTVTSTRVDRRESTRTAVRTVVSTVLRTERQPAVTRVTTVYRTQPAQTHVTTVYATNTVTQTRYATRVVTQARQTTVRDIDYETVYSTVTRTRVQPTTVTNAVTVARTTTVYRTRTSVVAGRTVTSTVVVTVRAPRPAARQDVTRVVTQQVTRTQDARPVTRTQVNTATQTVRGQDRVVTETTQADCGYNYNAPTSGAFNFRG